MSGVWGPLVVDCKTKCLGFGTQQERTIKPSVWGLGPMRRNNLSARGLILNIALSLVIDCPSNLHLFRKAVSLLIALRVIRLVVVNLEIHVS